MDSILCLDLGTRMGWAFRNNGGIVLSGSVDFSPGKMGSSGLRFILFRDWLRRRKITTINRVYFEAVHRHLGTDAAHCYGGFLGILIAERMECVENDRRTHYLGVGVGVIKKAATGKGNASKRMVQDAVRILYRLPRNKALSSDEADALALLHWATAGGNDELS
jgi:crossover junction endodeoxyribonuclease RuvC